MCPPAPVLFHAASASRSDSGSQRPDCATVGSSKGSGAVRDLERVRIGVAPVGVRLRRSIKLFRHLRGRVWTLPRCSKHQRPMARGVADKEAAVHPLLTARLPHNAVR